MSFPLLPQSLTPADLVAIRRKLSVAAKAEVSGGTWYYSETTKQLFVAILSDGQQAGWLLSPCKAGDAAEAMAGHLLRGFFAAAAVASLASAAETAEALKRAGRAH